MANLRRAGLISFEIDGERYDVVGNIEYTLGETVREELVGADRVHGFMEKPGTPTMSLELRDEASLDVAKVLRMVDVTCMAELTNGKTVFLRNAFQAGEGTQGTEEGAIAVRFVGETAEEID